jgi:hypothetical protein
MSIRVGFVVVLIAISIMGCATVDQPAPQTRPSASCVRLPVSPGVPASGSLADTDCESPHRRGAKAELHFFQGVAGQRVTIAMSSSAFDSYLILVGPDNRIVASNDDVAAGNSNSRIEALLSSTGTYTIEATSYRAGARGTYSLSLAVSSDRACTRSTITHGVAVSGSLADIDCEAPHRPGRKAELRAFQGTAGQRVTITMSSSAFDSYLVLVGPDNRLVAEDDDGQGNRNSRIEITLPSTGTYTIEATAYGEKDRGSYSLLLSTACALAPITQGLAVSGSLTESACEAPHRPGRKAELHSFQGTAGQRVSIAMSSLAFDSYLILVGPDNRVVAENDDGPAGRNSRIEISLPSTGTYTIEATALGGAERGSYSLLLTAATCTPAPITPGLPVSGSLTHGDCESTHRAGRKADLHAFRGTAGQRVSIDMNSDAFDAYLILVGPDNRVVAENDDGPAGRNSRIEVSLPSTGTYTIVATALGAGERGNYTLLLSGSAPAQQGHRPPYSVASLEDLLRSGVLPRRLVTLITERGVAFRAAADAITRLLKAGADAKVIAALRDCFAESRLLAACQRHRY